MWVRWLGFPLYTGVPLLPDHSHFIAFLIVYFTLIWLTLRVEFCSQFSQEASFLLSYSSFPIFAPVPDRHSSNHKCPLRIAFSFFAVLLVRWFMCITRSLILVLAIFRITGIVYPSHFKPCYSPYVEYSLRPLSIATPASSMRGVD